MPPPISLCALILDKNLHTYFVGVIARESTQNDTARGGGKNAEKARTSAQIIA
jgi:hypothetical protein